MGHIASAVLPQAERDQIRKLTGQGRFTADETFAGCTRAVFVRSPYAHARLIAIDSSAAAAMPGVVLVLTGADFAEFHNFPVMDRIGKGLIIPRRPVMAQGVVRHVGEAVAVVIAETQAQALDAAEAVLVDYEPLDTVIGLTQASQADRLVHPQTPGNVALRHDAGDAEAVAAAMAMAAVIVETEIELPRLAPITMEPRAAFARYEGGGFTLRVPHQGVNEMRRDLAVLFGLPPERFQVLDGDVGGGFGARSSVYPEYPAILEAARRSGRAVAWHGTRTESFLTDIQGRGVRVSGRLAVDDKGRFTALAMSYDVDMGAYLSPAGVFAALNNPLQSVVGCYAIPTIHADMRALHSHAVPTGPYRGAGRPEMALLVEHLVDIAARRLGMDPFVLRARNAIAKAAFPYTLPNGPRYDSADFAALLDIARTRSDWDGFAGRAAEAQKRGALLGRGMALFIEVSGGGGLADEASLTLSADEGAPRLVIETVTFSTGQSHARTFAKIAGPRLGLAETSVRLVAGDPATRLAGAGSFASRSTIAAGSAVAAAADEIAGHLLGRAALRANCPAAELRLLDEAVQHVDGSLVCAIAALLDPPIAAIGRVTPAMAFSSGCHVVELEVARDTGAHRLTRYFAVDDAGVTIDHQAAEAQIHGGIAQGVGEVLTEESVIESDSGQMIAASLMDYCMPRADDLPGYVVDECNTPSPFNPLGVKGIGEAGTTGALSAVTSAVYDLLGGSDLPRMPFTSERLLRVLRSDINVHQE